MSLKFPLSMAVSPTIPEPRGGGAIPAASEHLCDPLAAAKLLPYGPMGEVPCLSDRGISPASSLPAAER